MKKYCVLNNSHKIRMYSDDRKWSAFCARHSDLFANPTHSGNPKGFRDAGWDVSVLNEKTGVSLDGFPKMHLRTKQTALHALLVTGMFREGIKEVFAEAEYSCIKGYDDKFDYVCDFSKGGTLDIEMLMQAERMSNFYERPNTGLMLLGNMLTGKALPAWKKESESGRMRLYLYETSLYDYNTNTYAEGYAPFRAKGLPGYPVGTLCMQALAPKEAAKALGEGKYPDGCLLVRIFEADDDFDVKAVAVRFLKGLEKNRERGFHVVIEYPSANTAEYIRAAGYAETGLNIFESPW